MAHDIERLKRLVPLVDRKIAAAREAAGEFRRDGYDAWVKRSDKAEAELKQYFAEKEGALFTRPHSEHAVRMAGIRSASTSGFLGALHNWRRAALAAIGAAAETDDPINLQGSGPAPIEPREG